MLVNIQCMPDWIIEFGDKTEEIHFFGSAQNETLLWLVGMD